MSQVSAPFEPFDVAMKSEGLAQVVIDTFRYYYEELHRGSTGMVPEAEIDRVDSLPDLDELPSQLDETGRRARAQTVSIKLNGGLGTSMGLDRAKSLLRVREELTFLDIIARQTGATGVPLVLMNSFATRRDTLEALEPYPEVHGGLPADFLQHKVPKIDAESLAPARWPANPALEWCPPGHGDIYPALLTSGLLAKLIASGRRYAFVSNSDNLGALIDDRLLGFFAESGAPFMMEVADRTEADRKGGHLARRHADGQLVLRESAQCPESDSHHFQDTSRHRFFNTNSLWLDLHTLSRAIEERQGVLGLPMIRNAKTLDPRDPTSPRVFQLETAMGSAIAAFEGATAIRVPRRRFAPVKTTSDLLAVRSDAYILRDDWALVGRGPGINVVLDPQHYGKIDDLDLRFPDGPPSLAACHSLKVRGDVRFGRHVEVRGDVELTNTSNAPVTVADDSVVDSSLRW